MSTAVALPFYVFMGGDNPDTGQVPLDRENPYIDKHNLSASSFNSR